VRYASPKQRESQIVAESTRRSMRANKSVNTRPEVGLRRSLWHAGLRGYRKNDGRLPGTPDVVFGRAKLAIFVHGCFWHGCPTCTRNLTPKTNALYWSTKIAQNKERDERNRVALEALGYRVLVLWECELTPKLLPAAVERVREELRIGGLKD